MSVSLLEAKANFVEWCKSFLNTHVDYKKDMPFDIDFVAKAIWKKIENSYENLLYLEEQNVALRDEADTNAALSIKHKMLAYELKAENAALRERLSKAVELPCKVGDKVYIPWVWDNQSGIMEAPVITIRLYPYIRKYEIRLETDSLNFAQKYHYGNFNDKDFGTLIFTTREAAEARLKDLQGGKQ